MSAWDNDVDNLELLETAWSLRHILLEPELPSVRASREHLADLLESEVERRWLSTCPKPTLTAAGLTWSRRPSAKLYESFLLKRGRA